MFGIGNKLLWCLEVVVFIWCLLMEPMHSLQQWRTVLTTGLHLQPSLSTSFSCDINSYTAGYLLGRRYRHRLGASKEVEAEKKRVESPPAEEEWVDPYASMLNLNRQLSTYGANLVLEEYTMQSKPPKDVPVVHTPKERYFNAEEEELVRRDPRYRKFYEESIAMEEEDSPDGRWYRYLNDYMEMETGRPLGSNRTVEEILAAKRRMERDRKYEVSREQMELIIAVYTDRTYTLARYRKEDPFSVDEFHAARRKYFAKTKQDILPKWIKRLVTKGWLKRKPWSARVDYNFRRTSYKSYAMPKRIVILDEVLDEARAGSTSTNEPLKSIANELRGRGRLTPEPEGNLHTPLATFSIVNWDKSREEINAILNPVTNVELNLLSNKNTSNQPVFKVDDMEMHIANHCPAEYFVAL